MKRKVLLVDDNVQMVDFIKLKLLEKDFEVFTANNGFDGLEKVEMNHPDIIILDIMMPRCTGLEVKEKLKENDLTKDIPIIFLTSSLESNPKKRDKLLGEGYLILEKAIEIKVLIKAIKCLLNS